MNVVTGHIGTDFDALASMVAATKLYPNTTPVLPGSVDRRVREFCNLFADSFTFARSRDIDRHELDTLIVVDCNDARRLGAFKDLAASGRVRVHVFDHHVAGEGGGQAHGMSPEVLVAEAVGSTTTLMVERLPAEAGIDSRLATLLTLGIYEETGCLLHSNTTVRDVECVARLLKHGANLDVVATYVNRSLTPDQRALLDDLVLNSEHHEVKGLAVCVATAKVKEFIGGVAILTSKLLDIQNVAVAVSVVEQEDSVLVVGRSRVDAVDLAAAMEVLGGGGHHRAASATLRGATLDDARLRTLEALQAGVVETGTARVIMSAPVRFVTPDTSVADAARVMLRYGHAGLPVMDPSGTLEGIVTRKEVDGAQHHGLGHAPVSYCMTKTLEWATPETPVLELESRLANSTVGRLPVVEGGRVVGIISRSDVLRARYDCVTPWHRLMYRPATEKETSDVAARLVEVLPAESVDFLRHIGRLGVELGTPCYLVGGSVRDVLLGAANVDLDLLVEGDAIPLARHAAQESQWAVRCHERFGTAQLELPGDLKVDLATARTEFYEHPAALPQVEETVSLREDLYRRDFTVNTMAIDLSPESFGQLVDYFGGRQDLQEGIIRVLHSLSFVEDPTRMFRAVRFEQRFGFQMDPQTEALITAARDPAALDALTPERLRNELILLLKETDPIPAIHRLSHLDLLREIDPALELNEEILSHVRRVKTLLRWAAEVLPGEIAREWPLVFWPLLAPLAVMTVRSLCDRLRFDNQATSLLVSAQESGSALASTLSSPRQLRDSALRYLLRDIPTEVQVAALSLQDTEIGRARVEHFHGALRDARADVKGDDLMLRGFPAGPSFGPALNAALRVKLDDKDATFDDQLRAAEEVLRAAAPKDG